MRAHKLWRERLRFLTCAASLDARASSRAPWVDVEYESLVAAPGEELARLYGELGLEYGKIDYVEHDWTREQWTGGGPVANYAPGTMVRFGKEIRKPHGRVHWAGTETSTAYFGLMEGAIRSGHRVAAEISAHQLLGRPR